MVFLNISNNDQRVPIKLNAFQEIYLNDFFIL